MKSILRTLSDRRGNLVGRVRRSGGGLVPPVLGGLCVALSPAVGLGPGYIESAALGMALSALIFWLASSYGRHAGVAV